MAQNLNTEVRSDATTQSDAELVSVAALPTAPFLRDTDTDIVLRSSDHVEFWVAKTILTFASPVFRDMFMTAIPPPEATHPEDYVEGTPVVAVTEASRALDQLLRFCYPVANPTVDTLDDTVALLHAGRKYEISMLQTHCAVVLRGLAQTEPMRVFAVACIFDMEDIARIAARQSLFLSLDDLLAVDYPEARYMSHASFRSLCAYRQTCQSLLPQEATWERWYLLPRAPSVASRWI